MDGCNAKVSDMKRSYPALGKALNESGRPMVYSCSWPDSGLDVFVQKYFPRVENPATLNA